MKLVPSPPHAGADSALADLLFKGTGQGIGKLSWGLSLCDPQVGFAMPIFDEVIRHPRGNSFVATTEEMTTTRIVGRLGPVVG